MITEKDIIEAYTRIRTIDSTISDEVLDFIKNASIKQLRIGGVSNFVRQELERRVDLILSEPDGIVRETMIKNIPLDL